MDSAQDCISVASRPRHDATGTPYSHHHVSIAFEPSVNSRLESSTYPPYIRPSTNFEPLKSEQARLNTFNLPDCPWPVSFISPADCAKSGFFFLKDGDKVQCAFCRGVAGEWEEGDIPSMEHRKHFPRCPFICNLPVGNIPIGQNAEEESVSRLQEEPPENYYGFDVCGPFETFITANGHNSSTSGQVHVRGALPLSQDTEDVATSLAIQTGSGPTRKHLVTVESRLKTFTGWPTTTGQSPQKMADAGFFYIGTQDHVKCFYCDGGLRNWEECDDPWFEHARWFANCPYVLLNKGQDYIKQVVESKPPSAESAEPSKCSKSSESDDESGISTASSSEDKKQPASDSESPTPSASSYSDAENSPSSDDEAVAPTHLSAVKDSRELIESNPTAESKCAGTKGVDLAEELRKLQEARQCKICMDHEVGVVFLPCGHFVSCVRCATALSNCALCRQPIKAVVRTYLS